MNERRKLLLEMRAEIASKISWREDYTDVASVAARQAYEDVISYIDLLIDEGEL